jgi:hypothetical protein
MAAKSTRYTCLFFFLPLQDYVVSVKSGRGRQLQWFLILKISVKLLLFQNSKAENP